nr:hypothetical protein [uncultured Vibrio sp.]
MAITIRNTEKHEKMLSELKAQTGNSTSTKALIDGGYEALKYYELYQKERAENQRLRNKLYNTNSAVSDFLNSLSELQEVIND